MVLISLSLMVSLSQVGKCADDVAASTSTRGHLHLQKRSSMSNALA